MLQIVCLGTLCRANWTIKYKIIHLIPEGELKEYSWYYDAIAQTENKHVPKFSI